MARHVSTALAVLAAALVLLAYGSGGQAQDLVITVTDVADRDPERAVLATPYLFNKAECDGAKTLTLTVANFPIAPVAPMALPDVLDFWRGESCNMLANRTSTTGAAPACTYLFSRSGVVGAMHTYTDITVPDLGECVAAADGVTNIYVLAALGAETRAEITSYGLLATKFDVSPPDPPMDVMGGVGNTSVQVKWTASPGTGNNYLVYVSSAATSTEGGACGGGELLMGADAPAGEPETTVSGVVADLNPSTLGLAIGDSVGVGVVARDAAFNVSKLSDIACVTRVETCGYICQRGSPLATCSCSVPGARGAGGAVGASLLVATLALLFVRMRGGRSAR